MLKFLKKDKQPGNPACHQGEEDHRGVLDFRRALLLTMVSADDDKDRIAPHLE